MTRSPITRYAELPPLPDRIHRLDDLAVDLWWSWHQDARTLFRGLDYALWRSTAHNPVRMLWVIPREKLGRVLGPHLAEDQSRCVESKHSHLQLSLPDN